MNWTHSHMASLSVAVDIDYSSDAEEVLDHAEEKLHGAIFKTIAGHAGPMAEALDALGHSIESLDQLVQFVDGIVDVRHLVFLQERCRLIGLLRSIRCARQRGRCYRLCTRSATLKKYSKSSAHISAFSVGIQIPARTGRLDTRTRLRSEGPPGAYPPLQKYSDHPRCLGYHPGSRAARG